MGKKGPSKSSKQWLQRQNKDGYVKRANLEGYRSRSAYKLIEINKRHKILHKGMLVVDLGAAPGGWSQVAVAQVGKSNVFALDILPIDPIEGVDIIIGDFQEPQVQAELLNKLGGQRVDLVISDMAPNFSGIRSVDVTRAICLAEIAAEFAQEVLTESGSFLVKVFQGEGFTEYVHMLKQIFQVVQTCKPPASRAESSEVYVLARK